MKNTKPIVRIHNTQTDEVNDREMTNAEFAQYEADEIANDARLAKGQSNLSAKLALLEKLGITEDEAKLLLG